MCTESDRQWNESMTEDCILEIFTAGDLNLLHQSLQVIQNSSCHFLSSISEMKNIKLKESTDCLGLNCSFKEKSSLSAKKSSDRTQLF